MRSLAEVNGALTVLVIKYLVSGAYLEFLHYLLRDALTLKEREKFGTDFFLFLCISKLLCKNRLQNDLVKTFKVFHQKWQR